MSEHANGNAIGNGHGPRIYGVSAEFGSGADLLLAARATREAGFTRFDTYSPLPVHGMEEAVGQIYTKLPWIVFVMGISGAALGYGLQYWMNVIDYPLNIGGKPLNSWPAFIPITFEVTILLSGLTSALAMILMNGLPRLHHPVFNTPGFARASSDRFFLCIEADDPKFDLDSTKAFLEGLHPDAVSEVPE
ncbi:MAG: DUF3341 domain-containing protein [Myxococcales bacterium]|nr:DUF3341 domain-containing protein [Myxococcales bacterium]